MYSSALFGKTTSFVWCRVYGDAAGSIDALQFDPELGLLSEVEFHMFLPCLFFWFLHFPPKNIT